MEGTDHKIQLENYYGPLDLLLYLVRENEVEITEIPILRVTEQYISFLNMMQKMDLSLASDFLVMAATLLVIKARMLAPRPLTEEDLEDQEQDPRLDLIRKLIEYKKFKDAARRLGKLADAQSQRQFRRPYEPPGENEEEIRVDLRVWDLVAAYAKLMRTILLDTPASIIYDQVLVSRLMEDMVLRLRREKSLLFSTLAGPGASRMKRVGNLLAILQLAKQQVVQVEQEADFADIRVTLREEADTTALGADEFDAPPPVDAAPLPPAADPLEMDGSPDGERAGDPARDAESGATHGAGSPALDPETSPGTAPEASA